MHSRALALYRDGRFSDAASLAERALDSLRSTVARVWLVRERLAVLLTTEAIQSALANRAEAKARAQEAVALARRLPSAGERNSWLVEALTRLGTTQRLLAEYETAELSLTEAVQLAEASPRDPGRRANALNALGVLAKDVGQYERAALLYARVLDWMTHTYGAESSQLAAIHHNLAGLAFARGDNQTAQQHALRAVSLRRSAVPIDVGGLAADESVLATILMSIGDLDASARAANSARDAWLRLHGPTHYEVAVQNHIIGCIHHARGELDAAETFLREALDVKKCILGESHPEVATIRNNLAAVYEDEGLPGAAAQEYEIAATALRRVFGPQHPSFLVVAANLEHLRTERLLDAEL